MGSRTRRVPEALANTRRVADLCNVELTFQALRATFTRPDRQSADDYLRDLVYARRAAAVWRADRTSCASRIDYELDVIKSKGLAATFLIVWTWSIAGREQSTARGSGCSTVVGYCWASAPSTHCARVVLRSASWIPSATRCSDIDIDLCPGSPGGSHRLRPPEVWPRRAIINVRAAQGRAAIRDICRALDVPLSEADRVGQLVPKTEDDARQGLERDPSCGNSTRRTRPSGGC